MMTKACKKRRRVCVSSELGDLSTIFEVDESRLSEKDGVTSIPTCEHQSSYELKAESMNTRKIRWCTKILRKLIDHKGGWLFKEPVDPVLYGIPDYFDVICSPMDLGTVKNKLTKKQYVSIEEFAADVRLTFSNAMKYNPPGNDIHTVAKELNGIFDSKWESVKKKFRGPSPFQEQKTIFTKACKKRRGVCVSSELGDSSTVFEVEESRLTIKDGVTSIPTCEHQSSYELMAESMNTRKIRRCTKILRELMDHKSGWIFNQPVDPVLYGLPDYFDVIRNPMDLGTVKKKLTNKQYVSTDEFVADVRLTFSNGMKYNPPGNDIHAIAQQLNGIFDSKWESVKKKFRGPSPVQEQKTIFTKACKKRRGVCVSSELGDSGTVFEAEESRLSKKDGVTPISTCEHQSSYELKAESMNTRKIRLCGDIIRKLIDYKGGWLFKDPVDPVQFGIPDYFDVICNPMDLGTVKNKLTKKKYVSIEEFAADVRLTFSNAMKYNPPGNDVHTVAKELNRVFDLLWESMKRKFRGPSLVQEKKTIFTEVQAVMDSKSTIGCSNSKPSVIRRPVACSNSIAKKPLTDALSFKVKIISFVGSDEQISSKGFQKDEVSSKVEHGTEVLKSVALHFYQQGQKEDGDNSLAIKSSSLQ